MDSVFGGWHWIIVSFPRSSSPNIVVSGCSALFANQVAEQTLALLMGLIRRMPVFFRAQLEKEYIRRPTDDLFGKSVGIIGFGGNGQRIARVLRPLVDRILATDVFWEALSIAGRRAIGRPGIAADELDDLLGQVDVVIITLPMTQENEGRIGDRQFRLMRPGYLFD